eukprot:scaffold30285_cov63-Phaeocystis_antarctica.AAC.4
MVVTNLSLAQLAERETVVFTAISRSSVRLREGRPPQLVFLSQPLGEGRCEIEPALSKRKSARRRGNRAKPSSSPTAASSSTTSCVTPPHRSPASPRRSLSH